MTTRTDTPQWRSLETSLPVRREEAQYPLPSGRRSWTLEEFWELLPASGIDILDIGAGPKPFPARSVDRLVTADFADHTDPSLTVDVTNDWPFENESFDLVYMSHVVEHFYPRDRDNVMRKVHGALRPDGLLFIRVPHRSSFHSTGWEHYSAFGLNGVTSLCHGQNPRLPMFQAVSAGVATSIEFDRKRTLRARIVESSLQRSWRLTDTILAPLLGGLPEVQFLLRKLPLELEQRLRAS